MQIDKSKVPELVKLITELRDDYDHSFITVEGANHFGNPFGLFPACYLHHANPDDPKGLTLADGAESARGIGADDLAGQIADHLGVSWASWGKGRGFRLRSACDAIIHYLGGINADA